MASKVSAASDRRYSAVQAARELAIEREKRPLFGKASDAGSSGGEGKREKSDKDKRQSRQK